MELQGTLVWEYQNGFDLLDKNGILHSLNDQDGSFQKIFLKPSRMKKETEAAIKVLTSTSSSKNGYKLLRSISRLTSNSPEWEIAKNLLKAETMIQNLTANQQSGFTPEAETSNTQINSNNSYTPVIDEVMIQKITALLD